MLIASTGPSYVDPMTARALMIQGTGLNVGKSVIVSSREPAVRQR